MPSKKDRTQQILEDAETTFGDFLGYYLKEPAKVKR